VNTRTLPVSTISWSPRTWIAELFVREPTLARFGLLMWIAMIPAAIALGLDDRMLRGVAIWAKPLKFLASIGLFALTTAWFVGLLPHARRRAWPVRLVVGTLVATASFEVAYIVLQAALGQASHYNSSSPLHVAMYSAMGAAAIALTLTQPLLAYEIARHAGPVRGDAARASVVAGLVLTCALGACSGMMLGPLQPPAGVGLPGLGWQLGGDLRPAHFLGLHAQQLVPLAGFLLARALAPRAAMRALCTVGSAYVLGWAALMAIGLDGAQLVAPPRF
jgi:hypothetical protein